MPNLYKRPDSPYYWCWGYLADGRTKWRQSTKQRTKRQAEKAARAIEEARLNEADEPYPPVSVDQAREILRKHKERKGCAPSTMRMFGEKWSRIEEHFGRDRDMLTLTLADTEGYVDARRRTLVPHLNAAGQREDRPTSDHTIAKELGYLKSALIQMRKHDLYPREPSSLWPEVLDNAYQPRDRWLTVHEYRQLMLALPIDRRPWLTIYCHTGMRLGELYQCERRGDSLWVTQTKGNKRTGESTEREIPLSPDARAVLDARPLPWPRWKRSNVRQLLGSRCRKIGIEPVSANDLRRTFASWLCNAGVPELTVVKLMGHSSSKMIRKVYAQLAPSTLAAAVERLPSVTSAVIKNVVTT